MSGKTGSGQLGNIKNARALVRWLDRQVVRWQGAYLRCLRLDCVVEASYCRGMSEAFEEIRNMLEKRTG